jgi:hypothetical protein
MKKHLLILGTMGAILIAFGFTTNSKKNAQADKAEGKITICHYPPGNPANVQEITISKNAWSAHDAHDGDFIKTNCRPCPCLGEE